MTGLKHDYQTETMRIHEKADGLSVSTTDGNKDKEITMDERQIKASKRRVKQSKSGSLQGIISHFFWSHRRTFVLDVILCNVTFSCFISSFVVKEANCDDDLMQYQRPSMFESPRTQQQALNSGSDPRHGSLQLNLKNLHYNYENQHQESPAASEANYQFDQADGASSNNELTLFSNMVNQLNNQKPVNQEQRQNPADQLSSGDADLLETAQTKAQSSSVSASPSEGNDKSTSASSSEVSSSGSSPTSSSSSSSTPAASSGPLSEQLSAVSNLIQQAGQLGLTAAQQNAALSEAIINGVTNSLIRNTRNRKPGSSVQASASSRPSGNVVGQSIDGNIEYDSNQNAINGFIELPNLNFSNAKPAFSAAFKPFLVAALKTVPIKLGAVGWKLLQLLAWKKIYKAHHPKSGEIIIEQEIGKHSSQDKGSKLTSKVGDHLTGLGNKLKTSKMGQSYVSDDWMSMMRSTGGTHGADVFSSGAWPHGSNDPTSTGDSMIYQRSLLPPGLTTSVGQPAAAAAAAAAATAAAIQSHWIQQQNLTPEEASQTAEGQQMRSNQTSGASASGTNALKRKKASFGGGNWFAATPAQAYAAAAAAANAAASLASQHQYRHNQRLAHMMRAYDLSGNPDQMQMVATGPHSYGGAPGGFIQSSLFDNAAAMAVQNAVKLPPTDAHNPLATTDFLDQSDSLSGSSFGSPFSSMTNSFGEPMAESMTLVQRQDTGANPSSYMLDHSSGFGLATDGLLSKHPRNQIV